LAHIFFHGTLPGNPDLSWYPDHERHVTVRSPRKWAGLLCSSVSINALNDGDLWSSSSHGQRPARTRGFALRRPARTDNCCAFMVPYR